MAIYTLTVLLFASIFAFSPTHGWQQLSENNRRYIAELYDQFACPFMDVRNQNARYFGVLTTADSVDKLSPSRLQFEGQFLSLPISDATATRSPFARTVNYYAAIPDYIYDPPRLVEDQLKGVFDDLMESNPTNSVTDVYIMLYYTPCSHCATILSDLALMYPAINFHIGYMEVRGGSFTLVRALENFQNIDNIFIADVSHFCDTDNVGHSRCADFSCQPPAFWASWSNYGACSTTCGSNGRQCRKRDCILDGVQPGNCYGSHTQSRRCNTYSCPTWGSWSSWFSCTNCDSSYRGEQYRVRACRYDSRGDCPGSSQQSQSCSCPRPSSCFASDSTVRVQIPNTSETERKRLDQLKIGDSVESFDPETNNVTFSEVYFISHENETESYPLIKLVVDSAHADDIGEEISLRLHTKHLVYACKKEADADCTYPPEEPVPAENVKVGDTLWVRNHEAGGFSPRNVTSIGEAWSAIRHPMTLNHYIVVDDVMASVHVISESLYRQLTFPLRFLYGMSPSLANTDIVKSVVKLWDSIEEQLL